MPFRRIFGEGEGQSKSENCHPSLKIFGLSLPYRPVLFNKTSPEPGVKSTIHFALAQERFCLKGPGSTAKRGNILLKPARQAMSLLSFSLF